MKITQPVFKYNGLAEDSDICLQSSKTLDLDKPIDSQLVIDYSNVIDYKVVIYYFLNRLLLGK